MNNTLIVLVWMYRKVKAYSNRQRGAQVRDTDSIAMQCKDRKLSINMTMVMDIYLPSHLFYYWSLIGISWKLVYT